jgi:DNA/RNA-binding domain of Phe-tRNA-synthetase-like protein
MRELAVEPHPLLYLQAFFTEFPCPLGDAPPPEWLVALLSPNAPSPLSPPDDSARAKVRDLLRHGGFKPTGRSKPASEYLLRAAGEGTLESINTAVDACNVVSLHSGLPVSVIDLDRAIPPFRVAVAPEGARYVFNSAGQVIELKGLLCLFDALGPCANAVKDAQRTKTDARTRRTLSLVWGTLTLGERTDAATAWYRELLERVGARTDGGA